MPVLFAIFVANTIPAQLRKPVFVTVLDVEDRPVENARVTLASAAVLQLPGTADVVRATTDARGRCIARTIVGRPYSAWATSAHGEDASYVSEPVDFLASGALCELIVMHRVPKRTVAVEGIQRCCPEGGSSVVHLAFPDVGLAEVLTVVDDAVVLPPAPRCRTWLGLLDAQGSLLQVVAIEPEERAPTVRFRAPQVTSVEVLLATNVATQDVSAAGLLLGLQRPSNAVVGTVSSQLWRPIYCRAVDDGMVEVPIYRDCNTDWFRLTSPGHAPFMVCDRVVLSSDHQVPLRPSQAIVGKLRGLQSNERAYVSLRAKFWAQEGSKRFARAMAVPVACKQDTLRLDLPSRMFEHRVVMHLLPERANEGESNGSAPRLVVLAKHAGEPQSLDVDLDKLVRSRIRVVGPDGDVVPGAAIAVRDLVNGDVDAGSADSFTAITVSDLQGRAELLLDAGQWAIYTTDGTCQALEFVTTDIGEEDRAITLEPARNMTCRVVDAQGKPVRGARFERAPKSISAFNGVLQGVQGHAKESIAWLVAEPMLLRTRSNRDGLLAAPVQSWRPWQCMVRVRAGDLVSKAFQVAAWDLGELVVK